jgi:hypothetical protein
MHELLYVPGRICPWCRICVGWAACGQTGTSKGQRCSGRAPLVMPARPRRSCMQCTTHAEQHTLTHTHTHRPKGAGQGREGIVTATYVCSVTRHWRMSVVFGHQCFSLSSWCAVPPCVMMMSCTTQSKTWPSHLPASSCPALPCCCCCSSRAVTMPPVRLERIPRHNGTNAGRRSRARVRRVEHGGRGAGTRAAAATGRGVCLCVCVSVASGNFWRRRGGRGAGGDGHHDGFGKWCIIIMLGGWSLLCHEMEGFFLYAEEVTAARTCGLA